MVMKTLTIAAFVAAFAIIAASAPAKAQFQPCVWPNRCAK